MQVDQFKLLRSLIKRRIAKQCHIRRPIPAECRLAITLVYLAHGVCRQMLAWAFRVGVSTIGKILLETSAAIWDELSGIYLAQPNEHEWREIADSFYIKTGMPHVVGAVDGKHVQIKCPRKSGSLYFNNKQYFSIVLLAVCDSKYTFTAVDIGAYGSQSDGGALKISGFGNRILNGTMNLPEAENLPRSATKFPFYYVGDAAFPLTKHLMRPYPGKCLEANKYHFNKCLSRARVTIENTFGILVARWRVLNNSLDMFPENANTIVGATLILHNFVKFHNAEFYCPNNFVDHVNESGILIEEQWRQFVAPLHQSTILSSANARRSAFDTRDLLKNYLFLNK
ncbi:uncharacterized protein LOC125780088 [Bactrocera dorsalis]|uniref:Uncharacterized protein LOC125780088 n=1 Tax=Bactrocera dorsalis TaxID=27457 RepID=A0ABM3K7T6_BACDO|nr:uncharacterized protein LOC125780088 [Bactrocera dorsalis]